jgi:hypothetical protein
MPMPMSTSDMTRIKRLVGSTRYAVNGVVQTKDLVSNPSSTRGDTSFVGKLKSVRETSKIVDFKAAQVADFTTLRERRDDSGSGGWRIERSKTILCPPLNGSGICTTILPTKLITIKRKF